MTLLNNLLVFEYHSICVICVFNSVGSGSENFGFGFDCLSNLRVRVQSGLPLMTNFGFGFEASGLSGLTGLNFALKSAFSDNIFDFFEKYY